jgi:isoamylase
MNIAQGFPDPLGAHACQDLINFAVYSPHAQKLELQLFSNPSSPPLHTITLDPHSNRTGDIWHVAITNGPAAFYYAWQMDATADDQNNGVKLLDPYARGVSPTEPLLGFFSHSAPFSWDGVASPNHQLQDLIIYEMHLKGFTAHSSSKVKYPGTCLGVIEKIPHLLDLGVNAIELLPINRFAKEFALHPQTAKKQYNYWGYSTINYFSLENDYASNPDDPASALLEFKQMVKELHRHGIEIILDVVFNHTAEGNNFGNIQSFKGFAPDTYYLLAPNGNYYNYSGCGNTLNCNHPIVIEMIIKALRYWASEMHVDGFRFDLASIFYRGYQGEVLPQPPIIEAISLDPLLAKLKLIAEPWDAIGLYQVGAFDPHRKRWSEWNAEYRDALRRYIKGTGEKGEFATRISGSSDIYGQRGPTASINFITSHDGFTLRDLVSYNYKHNDANGEANRDGSSFNESWNCGFEGPTTDKNIRALRERQMRNFHLALMLSQGIPMVLMGDEYGHTKKGNNNTWNQDNAFNWMLWNQIDKNHAFYRFYKSLIHFRRNHRRLARTSFLTDADVIWHSQKPGNPAWTESLNMIAFTLIDQESSLYCAFNPSHEELEIELPQPAAGKIWMWVANTANTPPKDFLSPTIPVTGTHVRMLPYSSLLLQEGHELSKSRQMGNPPVLTATRIKPSKPA